MMRSAPIDALEDARFPFGACSNGALISSTSSVSACQASGEKRSRMTDAAPTRRRRQQRQRAVKFVLLQGRGGDQRRPRVEHVLRHRVPGAEQRRDVGH